MDEEMYSLPYKEALAAHRKKYGNNAPFMSKEQYELKQAEIASNKPIGLSPEAADVYAEANAVKNGTSVEEEKALNQAAIDRDNNPGVDDTKAIGATKEELDYMLQNGQISRAAYEKQIAAMQTPDVQEEMATGEKKADENVWDSSDRDKTVAGTVSEVVTPKKGDTKTEQNAKGQYNKSMMSIWDAYRNKLIDKETAGYFIIDAIATLAKNLGRSIGNVGAQFSGGTIDNGHDSSMWEQRRDTILGEEIQKEKEGVGSAATRQAESEKLDIEAKKIRNAYTPAQLENQIEMFKRELEMADINLDMAHSKTDLINFIKKDPNYAKSPFKMGLVAYLTQVGTAGAASDASSTLSNAINWMLTLAK